jgi:hypothetical protein
MAWEAAGGIALLLATVVALVWANVDTSTYESFWDTPITIGWGDLTLNTYLAAAVNDGLMTLFFLLIGLEVKRELAVGELSDRRAAAVPFAAALGGMVLTVDRGRFTVAMDVLVTANLLRADSFRFTPLSLKGDRVLSDLGLELVASELSASELKELDLLIVCGGLRTPLKYPELDRLLDDCASHGMARVTLSPVGLEAWTLYPASIRT